MNVKVYNTKAEEVGTIDLPEKIFGLSWNSDLIHQVVVAQQANRRESIAHAKGRSEVRGGGKKPWRQKGTGRARHGSIRSPLWKGGGVTFGPTRERNFSKKINKKMKRKALFIALSEAARRDVLRVVEHLVLPSGKTKEASAMVRDFGDIASRRRTLFVSARPDRLMARAVSNIRRAGVLSADSLNAEDVLKHPRVLLDKDAIEVIERHYKI